MRIGTYGNRRGQSTLEYLLIATAVIAAIALAATKIGGAVTSTMQDSKTAIDSSTDKFSSELGGGTKSK